MPLALFALTLSAFAIGTTEFVIVGLIPTIAEQLNVSLPSAGLLVSLYALGVAIGAPVLTALTGKVGTATACGIYDIRPEVCRTCMPGDPECLMARRRFNLGELPAGSVTQSD